MSEHRRPSRGELDRMVAELRAVRSSDPAAAAALRAVRLTAQTLEDWWIPPLADPSD